MGMLRHHANKLLPVPFRHPIFRLDYLISRKPFVERLHRRLIFHSPYYFMPAFVLTTSTRLRAPLERKDFDKGED